MSLLFPRKSNGFNHDVAFDKDDIIDEIKEQLPDPWMWYTINNSDPKYDLLIIRNKDVREEISHTRPFSSVKKPIDSVYSIVLGINVVNTFSTQKRFDVSNENALVTAAIEINSSRTLFDIIKEIDSKAGGIVEDGN
jgi:hypothetical protein